MATKIAVSKYCEECLKFRQKKCRGQAFLPKHAVFFGTELEITHQSGLKLCKGYEFDVRLYKFQDGSGEVETIKHVRERQVKRDIENEQQEAFDDFDLGASLNLDDFADFTEEE